MTTLSIDQLKNIFVRRDIVYNFDEHVDVNQMFEVVYYIVVHWKNREYVHNTQFKERHKSSADKLLLSIKNAKQVDMSEFTRTVSIKEGELFDERRAIFFSKLNEH